MVAKPTHHKPSGYRHGLVPEVPLEALMAEMIDGATEEVVFSSNGSVRTTHGGLEAELRDMLNILTHRPAPRREIPFTVVGSVLLPALAAAVIAALVLRWWSPAQAEHLLERLRGTRLYGAARARLGDAATRTRLTRISVSLYFVHEGCQAWQLKWAELSSSMVPLLTPFGPMRMMPHWQKGDATDLVLLVTAVLTAANVLPEVGYVLLLVDVVTDACDMVGQLFVQWLVEGTADVNELVAKKFSLLGAMLLVTVNRWRSTRAPPSLGEDGAVPGIVSLVVRLLISSLFLRVAHFELRRLLWPPPDYDIDPNDPHNVLWPKLLELALTLPFVLGFRTKDVARLLAATLCLEAASVWQFWWVAPLEARLHLREHFAVNVAVAGGLLLLQDLGGGRYTVDAWLKKAS